MIRLTPCYMLGLLVILFAPVVALYLRHGNVVPLPVASPPWVPSTASTNTSANSNWHVEYFTSTTLIERCYDGHESSTYVFKQWESAAPAAGCPGNNFSARFTGLVDFLDGDYKFHLEHDDGARLYVDGETVIDAWSDGSAGHDAPARAL
ncbi:MAG: PA14 domain-containing protein, partial [Chloroflexi bacterium]|nr:PA14 domain-containing protein [Chloroflexota bacterium]